MNRHRYLPYTLTLNSPAIVTALGGDPNSSLCLPFIPGAAVRGAVAAALGDPGADNSRRQEFHDLILSGKVRYLNAYPCFEDRRALPVPVSLRRQKDAADTDNSVSAIDIAAFEDETPSDEEAMDSWPDAQLTALDAGFLTIGEAQPTLVQPKLNARLHHQRDRAKGRAWKDRQGRTYGAIFSFESLDAGQAFQGIVQLKGKDEEELLRTENRIKELLGGSILVGRSRRAGYGGMATVEWGDARGREAHGPGCEGMRPLTGDMRPGQQFRLLLTSACIVRDPATGQIDPAALVELIGGLFGGRAVLLRRRWSFEGIGGFNRKWRLEVPQTMAVAAGSVFVFEAKQRIEASEIHRIEDDGLGEGKEEGYGRFVFLDKPLSTNFRLSRPNEAAAVKAGGQPPPLVAAIEAGILRNQIVREIEESAAGFLPSPEKTVAISNSLIGRLRTPLRGAPSDALDTLRRWLNGEREAERLKRPAMQKLERCVMNDGKSLAEWILEAARGENVLEWLHADVLAQKWHIVSEESAMRFIEARTGELSARLIDSVLAALALRNKAEEVGDER